MQVCRCISISFSMSISFSFSLALIAIMSPSCHRKNDKCLVLVGSYTIGKERVFRAIAHALGSHVWAEQRKRRIFETFQDAELNSMLTTQRSQAQVHVVSMQDVRMDVCIIYPLLFLFLILRNRSGCRRSSRRCGSVSTSSMFSRSSQQGGHTKTSYLHCHTSGQHASRTSRYMVSQRVNIARTRLWPCTYTSTHPHHTHVHAGLTACQ